MYLSSFLFFPHGRPDFDFFSRVSRTRSFLGIPRSFCARRGGGGGGGRFLDRKRVSTRIFGRRDESQVGGRFGDPEGHSGWIPIPWLRSDCHIGRPEDAQSRACLLPRGSDLADSSLGCGTRIFQASPARRRIVRSVVRLFPRYLGNARARGMRAYSDKWEVQDEDANRKAKSGAQEIFDATRNTIEFSQNP